MNNFNFLLAHPANLDEIMDIYHSLIGTPGCTWCLEYPDRALVESDIAAGSLYILKKNDRIIAVAAAGAFDELGHMSWTPKNPCELARIGVIPELQGRGIGALMLNKVMQAAVERGFDGMILLVSKTNPMALSMYEKNGFERRGETFMYGNDYWGYQRCFAPSSSR